MASPISRLGYFILRPCQLSSSVNSLAISSVIPYPHPHPISSLSPIIISVPYYHICPVLSFLSPIIISVPYYHFCLLLHLQFPVNWHQTTSSQTITSNAITESTNPKSVYGQFGLPMHVWLEDWFSWDLRYRIYCLGLRRLLLGRYMFLGRYRSFHLFDLFLFLFEFSLLSLLSTSLSPPSLWVHIVLSTASPASAFPR